MRNQGNACGVIAAGCESGHLQLYSASKLLNGEDALVASQDKHTGSYKENHTLKCILVKNLRKRDEF